MRGCVTLCGCACGCVVVVVWLCVLVPISRFVLSVFDPRSLGPLTLPPPPPFPHVLPFASICADSVDSSLILRNTVDVTSLVDPVEPIDLVLQRCHPEQLMQFYGIGNFKVRMMQKGKKGGGGEWVGFVTSMVGVPGWMRGVFVAPQRVRGDSCWRYMLLANPRIARP